METGNGIEYHNLDKTRRFFQWLVRFIDDKSIILKLEDLGYNNSVPCMIAAAKKYMEIWQHLVHITCGELEVEKFSYAVIYWKLHVGNRVSMYN